MLCRCRSPQPRNPTGPLARMPCDAFARTRLRSRIARARRARQPELGAAARAGVARGRPARGNRPHRLQCDGGRGARRELAGRQAQEPPWPGSPSRRPLALAEELARACPDVVLDSALCGDELVGALLGWTSVCDLADLRTDPWRVAIALGSEGEGALDGLDGVDVIGRGADARRLADWLSAGVKVPVWIVGDDAGIQGVRLRFGTPRAPRAAARARAERLAGRCARPRGLRARAGAGAAGLGRAPAPRRLTRPLSARASPGC